MKRTTKIHADEGSIGDLLEAKVEKGSIVLKPKVVPDRNEHPPAQRRRIDTELASSSAKYRAGKSYGPFETADDMMAHMQAQLKKRGATKIKRSR